MNNVLSNSRKISAIKKKTSNGTLYKDITKAIKSVGAFGSIEIYIQNNRVTQITQRSIKKTEHELLRV